MTNSAYRRTSLLAILLSASVLAAPPAAANASTQASARPEQKLTQLIIKYHNEVTYASAAASGAPINAQLQIQAQRLTRLQGLAQSYGSSLSVQRQIVTGGWVYRSALPLPAAQMRALARQIAAADSSIDYAEPDYIRHAMTTPADQWDIQASSAQPGSINLPGATALSSGANIIVAVLDTGYRPHHSLVPNLIAAPSGSGYGYNFISDAATARLTLALGASSVRGPDALDQGDWVSDNSCGNSDSSWHGTHVAGTIAALNNPAGTVGIAPSAKILALRVLGKCGGTDSDIADAVAWAAGIHVAGVPDNTNKAHVINLSLGGTGICSKTAAAVFQSAMAAGTVVVVAAGNESRDAKLSAPANCPGVIAVASNAITGGRASYSNYGGTVAVTAPGGGFTSATDVIYSTLPSGKTFSTDDQTYGSMAGTSQATPHVAAVVALMLAVNPKLSPAQIKAMLIKTARNAPSNCPGCGAGLVDASAAVKAAAGQ